MWELIKIIIGGVLYYYACKGVYYGILALLDYHKHFKRTKRVCQSNKRVRNRSLWNIIWHAMIIAVIVLVSVVYIIMVTIWVLPYLIFWIKFFMFALALMFWDIVEFISGLF